MKPLTQPLPDALRRYCVRCRAEISRSRVMRGSSFCGDICKREDKKARRNHREGQSCPTCKRAYKKKGGANDAPQG